jgi:hypothetical protein
LFIFPSHPHITMDNNTPTRIPTSQPKNEIQKT